MIAAALWAGYLAAHPAWPLIFAACCAAAAVYVWCMRAEDKRDDRAAGLPQAPRRGTRSHARAALARGASWGRRAIALRIHGITIDVGGPAEPPQEVHPDDPGRPWHLRRIPAPPEGTDEAMPSVPPRGEHLHAQLPEEAAGGQDGQSGRRAPMAGVRPGLATVDALTPPAGPTRLAIGAERAAAAPAPGLAPPAALSPWEHQTQWFTLDAIDADIKAREAAAAGGDA